MAMFNLVLYGVAVHLVFLASIFIIYFQSPVIQGLEPQDDLTGAPAKRLVLFVADGLRAESFYRDNCEKTSFLRSVILKSGIQGISHTRVPTESRPGHVALIAGLYEDPSAVLRGWQENPVNFDSVFNRSKTTYAWGSPDVLSIFTSKSSHDNIVSFSYDTSDEDFSGKSSTIALDNWVFDNVETFLRKNHQDLVTAEKTVFFLHLLGLDTAGHVHKPNSLHFNENLVAVDKGIARIVKLIDEHFRDGKTAYVFTADHGMTDGGSHGSGNAYETETPFLAWGAGVSYWVNIKDHLVNKYSFVGNLKVPSYDIEQADVAPLMSSLIGVAVPVNNFGRLPELYLNTSREYVSRAMFNNALQISTQYKFLRAEFAKGLFSRYLNEYDKLNDDISMALQNRITTSINNRKYDDAIDGSKEYMKNALFGIEYFQTYYQHWLLCAVAASMFGWAMYLQQRISKKNRMGLTPVLMSKQYLWFLLGGLGLIIATFAYLQNMSLAAGILLLLPIFCWMPCSAYKSVDVLINRNTWLFILATDMLVWTFFYRSILSVLLVVLPIMYVTVNKDNRHTQDNGSTKWMLTCFVLAIFPSLPIVSKIAFSNEILYLGLFLWFAKLLLSLYEDYDNLKLLNFVLFVIAAINVVVVVKGFEHQRGITYGNQIISWGITGASITLPLLQSQANRLAAIIDYFCIPFVMMSLSYEPLFLFFLSLNLCYWVNLEHKEQAANKNADRVLTGPSSKDQDFKRAYAVMIYVLIALFGTGNLASISSFDPNCVRCFIATFSPFTMSALIIMKLLIPVLLLMCASTTINQLNKVAVERFFVIILLICDIMCVHFLFLVKNKGSWLDIGVSISHFVIMESTVVVLCVLQIVSNFLLNANIGLFGGIGNVNYNNKGD